MGNCITPVMGSRESHEQHKAAEEKNPLVSSPLNDQVVLASDDRTCKKRKKVRFNVQEVDNTAAAAPMETTIRLPRMKRGVRVKVVLTQSELKQILNRATTYHYPPSSSSVDQVLGQVTVKCSRSRRSPLMCRCKCCWSVPALQTIPESGYY